MSRCLAVLFLCGFVSVPSVSQAVVEPSVDIQTLWVADDEGVLRLGSPSGELTLELPGIGPVRAVDIDLRRGLVWVFARGSLKSYDFAGEQRLEVPLGLPESVHADLAIRDLDGAVWLAVHRELLSFGTGGQALASAESPEKVVAVAVDQITGDLWVASERSVTAFDGTSGAEIGGIAVDRGARVAALAADGRTGVLWLALDDRVEVYDRSGALTATIAERGVRAVAADVSGGAWLATKKELLQVNEHGAVLRVVAPLGSRGTLENLTVTWDRHVWSANQTELARVDADLDSVDVVRFEPPVRIWDLAAPQDFVPPTLEILSPPDGWCTSDPTPTLELLLADVGSGVHLGAIEVASGEGPRAATCVEDGAGGEAACTFVEPLADGEHELILTTADRVGNLSQNATLRVVVDTVPPQLAELATSAGPLSNQPRQTLYGTVDEESTIIVAGQEVTLASDGPFAVEVDLVEGYNAIEVTVTDCAGNASSEVVEVVVDTVPPPAVDLQRVTVTVDAAELRIGGEHGATEAGANVEIENLANGTVSRVVADGAGAFLSTILGGEGDTIRLVAIDRAGNAGPAAEYFVPGAEGPDDGQLPPDPASVAPPVPSDVVTDIAWSTEFLYSGPDPIQRDVAPGSIKPVQVTVLRGQVLDREGGPLAAARVEVLGHPEWGWTLSREDGHYDLAVNGGGQRVLTFRRAGYLEAQRRVEAPWRSWAWVDDVALVSLDVEVTAIESGAAFAQLARGTLQQDASGSRQATLIFAPGTEVSAHLPDGSVLPLPTASVRATEFTVGPGGVDAMPAPLPATTGYTYAVELSVDEAREAGATRVDFDRPVAFYVENFLAFPVGSRVPAGYYDRQQASWIASDDGVVVEVLSTAPIALDLDGDGSAENASTLSAFGINDAELQQLAAVYQPGAELWRVPITHFTPWDCNWPYGPPPDAQVLDPARGAPNSSPDDAPDDDVDRPSCASGSIIECENQILRKSLNIPGNPFSLNYRSDTAPGRSIDRRAVVPLTGVDVPSSLKRIVVELSIAGQRHRLVRSAAPNQSIEFEWDGLDAFGRATSGFHELSVRIGYVYPGRYYQPEDFERSFGTLATGTVISPDRERSEVILWRLESDMLRSRRQDYGGLGGWTLDVHHSYDVQAGVLLRGDGSIRPIPPRSVRGAYGSGGGVRRAGMVAVGSDGSVYVGDEGYPVQIHRIHPDGKRETIGGWFGDVQYGIPAIESGLGGVSSIAVDRQGNVFYSARHWRLEDACINKIDTEGILRKVLCGAQVTGLAADDEGNIYYSDLLNHRVKRLGKDGTVSNVAGVGSASVGMDAGLALHTPLWAPTDLAIAADGSIFVVEAGTNRVRKISPGGRMVTVMAGLFFQGLDVAGDGTVYAVGTEQRYDVIERVRVKPPFGEAYDAFRGSFVGWSFNLVVDGFTRELRDVAIGQNGELFISDTYLGVRSIAPSLPRPAMAHFRIPSVDESYVYEFDEMGRHLRTRDALTGAVVLSFTYSEGRLVEVTDVSGEAIRVERDTSGQAVAIVGPNGERVEVQVEASGVLGRVTSPSGVETRLSYDEGLLVEVIDANANRTSYAYSATGRLIATRDAAGAERHLRRSPLASGGHSVAMETALGHEETFSIVPSSGGRSTSIHRHADGTMTLSDTDSRDSMTVTQPDGSILTAHLRPSPTFGLQTPVPALSLETPSGRRLEIEMERVASSLSAAQEPWGFARATNVKVNGDQYATSYNPSTRSITRVTPEGRQHVTRLDDKGRVILLESPGSAPVSYEYDSRGRLEATRRTASGQERVWRMQYGPDGRINMVIDPAGQTQEFDYDLDGRLVSQTLGNDSVFEYGLDPGKRLTSITPPGRAAHYFDYTPVSLPSSYTPPALPDTAPTTFRYDLDRRPTFEVLGDLSRVEYAYDDAGRIASVQRPTASLSYAYDASTGQLASVSRSDGPSLSFAYDGFLMTRTIWEGPISGEVSFTYDDHFRIGSVTVGQATYSRSYDRDGLLVATGDLEIARSPLNGRLEGTILGGVGTAASYDAFGELAGTAADFSGAPLLTSTLERDSLGRVIRKVEQIGAATAVFEYDYDARGRLQSVTKDGHFFAKYSYDANGNRVNARDPWEDVVATYDAQDRLLSYGEAAYSYNGIGQLAAMTEGVEATTYDYDVAGNLRQVVLPTGIQIEYLVDPMDRRVGKLVNGVLTQSFLYLDALNPVAEFDSEGNLAALFVYGTMPHVPDFLVKGGRTFRYLTDPTGSVRLVVDISDGSVAQRLDYGPFGRVLLDTNPGFQPFGFAGGLYDPQTRLVRFGARDYDPRAGRWTAKDPMGFAGGDTNLYAYAGNDPINFIDPSGAFAWVAAGAVIGAVVNVAFVAAANDFQGLSARQLGAAAASGAIAGAIGAVAGPLGGTIARAVAARSTSGLFAAASTGALSAAGGAAGQGLGNLIDPCHAGSVANAALWAGIGGAGAKHLFKTKNMNSWAQVNHFNPTTLKGLVKTPNARMNATAFGASAGVGAAASFPQTNPFD